jgi:hypothetical protein
MRYLKITNRLNLKKKTSLFSWKFIIAGEFMFKWKWKDIKTDQNINRLSVKLKLQKIAYRNDIEK